MAAGHLKHFQQCFFELLRDFQQKKSVSGIAIIFATLVNDPQITMKGGLFIGNDAIKFPNLQGS